MAEHILMRDVMLKDNQVLTEKNGAIYSHEGVLNTHYVTIILVMTFY